MTLEELRAEFSRLYLDDRRSGGKVVTVHLFGIAHADQLRGENLPNFCISAGVPVSFATELRKGMSLARYVDLTPEGLEFLTA